MWISDAPLSFVLFENYKASHFDYRLQYFFSWSRCFTLYLFLFSNFSAHSIGLHSNRKNENICWDWHVLGKFSHVGPINDNTSQQRNNIFILDDCHFQRALSVGKLASLAISLKINLKYLSLVQARHLYWLYIYCLLLTDSYLCFFFLNNLSIWFHHLYDSWEEDWSTRAKAERTCTLCLHLPNLMRCWIYIHSSPLNWSQVAEWPLLWPNSQTH